MVEDIISIGKVVLDYSQYCGQDLYSDGEIENIMLQAAENGTCEDLLKSDNRWPILYHFSDIRENVIEWISFSKEDKVLEIGSGCGAVTGLLSRKCGKVTCVELSERRSLINAKRNKYSDNIEIKIGNFQDIEPSLGQYDYITLIGVLEYAKLYLKGENPYVELLKIARKHLAEDGKLIIAIENKVGLKYWNGACEDHTGKMYIGLNDYIEDDRVRTFSSKELKKLLKDAGFNAAKFYCAIPDYKLPDTISAYDYNLKPGTVRTYKKVYDKARFYNFMEDVASDRLCDDGMFSYMANSYVVVTGNTESDVMFVKYSKERKKEFRISTSVINDKSVIRVIKKPLTEEAKRHVNSLKRNEELCRKLYPRVNCVQGRIEEDKYISDYVEGDSLEEILYGYRNNITSFIELIDEYTKEYLMPDKDMLHPFVMTDDFKEIFGDVACDGEMCTEISNVDAIFSNIKIDRTGKSWIFDFEWVLAFDIPYKYTLWRAYRGVYYKYLAYLKNIININEYLNKLGISDDEARRYIKMEEHFREYVFGVNNSEEYTRSYEKPVIMQKNEIR